MEGKKAEQSLLQLMVMELLIKQMNYNTRKWYVRDRQTDRQIQAEKYTERGTQAIFYNIINIINNFAVLDLYCLGLQCAETVQRNAGNAAGLVLLKIQSAVHFTTRLISWHTF